jgi:hypothetical protein
MQKLKMTVMADIEYDYDPDSKEFKDALAAYLEVVDKNGDINGMFEHITLNLNRWGADKMVEGVGFIGITGRPVPAKLFAGITVDSDDLEFSYFID